MVRFGSLDFRFLTRMLACGALSAGCALSHPPARSIATIATPAVAARIAKRGASTPGSDGESASSSVAESALATWLGERLPKGGSLVARDERSIDVVHEVQDDETLADIAEAYVDITGIYLPSDLAEAIRTTNHIAKNTALLPGSRLAVPFILDSVPKAAAEGRLGLPDDRMLRGVHVRPFVAAGRSFPQVLDSMAARGMNLIVLDVKDADGHITYPSRVPLANEIGAVKKPSIHHLWRTIQMAHDHGIRVAMRIVCFHDLLLSHVREDLAVQSVRKGPLRIGWLDPANVIVQAYVKDLAAEALEAGADEIQIDYVRYPVEHVENADFKLKERGLRRTKVIASFVHDVHELTRSRGATLSVDIFGIVAEGVKTDLENLGQDPVLLARECDALSPMVYPSHYPKGFMGFDVPGDHPELVRIGVRKLVALIQRGRSTEGLALVRPWIQGMPWHAPSFGPQYIAEEVSHATKGGASGWMVWNPSQDYTDTWQAIARSRDDSPAK